MASGFVFTIYFFLASWLRRWRKRPAPAFPIYTAAPTPCPARPGPAPAGAARPEGAPAERLEDRLHRENPSLERIYQRVLRFIDTYGVCTASNRTLGLDWYGRGEHFCRRSVQRHLARLVELGAIEILELPQEQIRTGRAIRLPSDVPSAQLQLRLGDARPRRLTPHEVMQGCADPPPFREERRRTPERASGRQEGVTAASPVTPTDVTRDMSPDLGSGSGAQESSPRDRDRREREGGFTPAGKEAASRGATDEPPVFSLEERRAYRQKAAERRSRWTETFLPLEEHKLPADVCRQLLDAIPEKKQGDGALRGFLYATLEEREQAAGRLPLRRAAAPPGPSTPAPAAAEPELPPRPPACHEAASAWATLRAETVVDAPANVLALYVDQVVPIGLGEALTLWAPNRFIRDAVEERFALSAAAAARGRPLRWVVPGAPEAKSA